MSRPVTRRGRFESLIVSHHSRFTCECNKEDINDDDDDAQRAGVSRGPTPNPKPRNVLLVEVVATRHLHAAVEAGSYLRLIDSCITQL